MSTYCAPVTYLAACYPALQAGVLPGAIQWFFKTLKPLPCRLVYYLVLSNGIVLAYLIAALSPNMDVANALLPTCE